MFLLSSLLVVIALDSFSSSSSSSNFFCVPSSSLSSVDGEELSFVLSTRAQTRCDSMRKDPYVMTCHSLLLSESCSCCQAAAQKVRGRGEERTVIHFHPSIHPLSLSLLCLRTVRTSTQIPVLPLPAPPTFSPFR